MAEKLGFTIERLKLLFEGKELVNDDQRLQDAGLIHGSAIHCVFRVQGGAPE